MSLAAHIDAFLALVRGDVELADRTYDGLAEDASGQLLYDNYCVVFSEGRENVRTRAFELPSTAHQRYEIPVMYVGVDLASCRAIADAVSDQVLGKTPPIAGRQARPIRSAEDMDRIRPDTSLGGGRALFFTEETWILASDPA